VAAFVARRFLLLPLITQTLERRLLDAAADHGGSLTPIQAARALRLPVREAEAALNALARSGHVHADLDETAAIVRYRFAGLDEPPRLDKP
jgi:hypothetical protein